MATLSLSGQTRQRQIVMVAVGVALLGGLLLFQVPRTMKMLKGDEVAATPPTQATTPVTPLTPGATPTPVPTTPTPTRSISLARFKSKDPFVQQVIATPEGAESTTSSTSGTSAPASEPQPAPEPEPVAEAPAFTAVAPAGKGAGDESAKISVNGVSETVSVSETFPEANPVFKLAAVGSDTVKVGVASGTLKGGSQTVTLQRGEPLTLLNTVDGKRYKLELVSVSS